jgi:hypothetical protein
MANRLFQLFIELPAHRSAIELVSRRVLLDGERVPGCAALARKRCVLALCRG